MENLGDRILRKIKEEKISPKPRWKFLLEDYFIWFFFIGSLLFGALAFCTLLHIFSENDWDLYIYLHTSLVGHVLASIPYIWFAILLVFVWIANYNYRHTKSGYRQETYLVVALSIIGSLIAGTFLHTLGLGEKIEEIVASRMPYYEKLTCCGSRKDIWNQPAIGLLGGQIVEVHGDGRFDLKSFNGSLWVIQRDQDALRYDRLKTGAQVKIIGEKMGDNEFSAREIRPWKKN